MEESSNLSIELHVGAAKVGKYATSESGDTLEMIERPHGGLSLVLVDGQRSGSAAKRISNLVARKAVSLLAEGVRDGAAARAAHDYLRTYRQGKVSAELTIVSVDLVTRTLVISRNSHSPALVMANGAWQSFDLASDAIGVHVGTKPVICELSLAPNIWVVAFTDGILQAGSRYGTSFDIRALAESFVSSGAGDPPALAETILAQAVELDQGRPQDDMSVLVLGLLPAERADETRRMAVRFPLPPI